MDRSFPLQNAQIVVSKDNNVYILAKDDNFPAGFKVKVPNGTVKNDALRLYCRSNDFEIPECEFVASKAPAVTLGNTIGGNRVVHDFYRNTPPHLFIQGDYGVGKTTLALTLAKQVERSGWEVHFLSNHLIPDMPFATYTLDTVDEWMAQAVAYPGAENSVFVLDETVEKDSQLAGVVEWITRMGRSKQRYLIMTSLNDVEDIGVLGKGNSTWITVDKDIAFYNGEVPFVTPVEGEES